MRSFSAVKRVVLSGFILFHIVVILSWALPSDSLIVQGIKHKVTPYVLWSGLFQSWDMFSPNPRTVNLYVEAQVTFADGATRVWKFPRMEQLGLVDRYFKERYRKFANDNLRLDANAALWPDAARYIAWVNANPANPPRMVKLVRSWQELAPPGQAQSQRPWFHYTFFTYPVSSGDLS